MAMKLSMTGQMRMEQRMKLAPRMIQSMEVLQLPLLALQEKIEAELNSNPVLELEEIHPEGDEAVEAAQEANDLAQADMAAERELVVGEGSDNVEDFQRLDSIGDDYDDYMHGGESFYGTRVRNSGETDKKMEALNNTAALGMSLNDYLKEQWRLVETEPAVMEAGELIIDYIDDKGYLTTQLEQLYNGDRHSFSVDDLHTALDLVQGLEPAGVGARDLSECILIQMSQQSDNLSFEIELVEEHWDDLLENHLPQIAKKMHCTVERINQAIVRLSKFDMSPGLAVGRHENHPITADVVVEADEDGHLIVELADAHMPNLRVNSFYNKMARNRKIDDKTREFLQKNIRSAQWFMDAIEQRKNTLLRVAMAVVEHQTEFFEKGQLFLKPLPMATIADQVGVHIATVSRAVAGKYVQCSQGILPLRNLFTGGTEDSNGQERSWDAVKAKLQQIVDTEDKSKPYNDDDLKQKLEEAGMGSIARRTVAKYRKIMNIPTARFRKKY